MTVSFSRMPSGSVMVNSFSGMFIRIPGLENRIRRVSPSSHHWTFSSSESERLASSRSVTVFSEWVATVTFPLVQWTSRFLISPLISVSPDEY